MGRFVLKIMNMRKYIYLLMTLIAFACTDEMSESGDSGEKIGKEYMLSFSAKSEDGIINDNITTRSDSPVDEDGRPVGRYTLDYMYLHVGDQALKLNLNQDSIARVRAVFTDKDHIQLTDSISGSSITNVLIYPASTIYFSSQQGHEVTMTQSDVTTPAGNSTYAPIGDVLFRSNEHALGVGRDNELTIDGVEWKDRGEVVDITMNRATSFITGNLVLANYENTEQRPNSDFNGWSARFFVSNFPISYDLERVSGFETKVGRCKDEGGDTRGIVSLTDEYKSFSETSATNHDHSINYYGYGIYDNSYSFVYWYSRLSDLTVYVSISNGSITKTLKVPLTSESGLNYNYNLVLSIVVDYQSVKDAFSQTTTGLATKSSSEFGDFLDVPYLVFVKQQ